MQEAAGRGRQSREVRLPVMAVTRRGSAHRYHPCADSEAAKTCTRSPPKRVPSADHIFRHCRFTVQPPRATVLEDNAALGSLQASLQAPGQTTGVAGAREK
ncbi:UNVERIFIED_CONTAM: hypothetical protein FKN15_055532 [Acipenser sinensis]